MTAIRVLSLALLLASPLAAGPAAANMCQADSGRTCPTGMPLGGYCECGGQGGSVVGAAAPRRARQASHADCQANPDAPGCQHQ